MSCGTELVGNSFGHTIENADERDIGVLGNYERVDGKINFGGRRDCCASIRCNQPMKFVVTYRYVTGRAGRIGRARKGHCQEHAEKFARRNGVKMPPTTPPEAIASGPSHAEMKENNK